MKKASQSFAVRLGLHFAAKRCGSEDGLVLQSVPVTARDAHRANGEHVQKCACTTTKKLITICWHESENNFSGSVLTAVISGFESHQHL